MLRLKKILLDRGITIQEFAGILGVSMKTAYNKINGKVEFTYSQLCTIVKTVPGIDLDYALEEARTREECAYGWDAYTKG